MKLRYLAALVLAMCVSSFTGAIEVYNKDSNILDVYGTLNVGHFLYNNDKTSDDRSFLRYGFIGTTQINDQLIGFGVLEYEAALRYTESAHTINNGFVRVGYVGIKCDNFGSIDYGRNYGVLYDVGSWTDVMPEFGGDIFISDNFLSNRAFNIITYRNVNFFGLIDGFNFALQYQGENDNSGKNNDASRSLKEVNGDGYGVSAVYSFDNGISMSAAYANSQRTFGQKALTNENSNNNAKAYFFGLKYDNNHLYLAALYGETYNMTPYGDFKDVLDTDHIFGFIDKTKNIELVAQYRFDSGLRPSIGYVHLKGDDIINGYNNYIKKYIEIGSSYIFNKNVLTTIDYRINLLKKGDFAQVARISTDNVLAMGMAYIF